MPIILANGDYFGNLCAIDPKAIFISDPKIVSMFSHFAQLIADQLDLKKISASTYATLLAERDVCEMRELFAEVLGQGLPKAWRKRSGPDQATADVAASKSDRPWRSARPRRRGGQSRRRLPIDRSLESRRSDCRRDREQIFSPDARRCMYLCRQIAEAHADRIAALSREGEGTLFTAKIPI